VVIGLLCIAGAVAAWRCYRTGSLGEYSTPNDAWFQSAVLQKARPVVVKFGAQWCGPCRSLEPELDELGRSGDIVVVRVDIEKHRDLARHYGVCAIPHLFLFDKGTVIAERVGYADHDRLRAWVADHTAL
jgi:thioredoxin